MSNVVNLTEKREKYTPSDLLTFKEVSIKYGYKYGFLYKWCVLENKIPCYDKRGYRAIRESDLLKFCDERTRKWRA